MVTIEQVLERLGHAPDRATLETYIARAWVRPVQKRRTWHFEEIDIARVQLVHHLRQEVVIGDDAMEVVLHLLDQLYGLREQMRRIKYAIGQQQPDMQAELCELLKEMHEETHQDDMRS